MVLLFLMVCFSGVLMQSLLKRLEKKQQRQQLPRVRRRMKRKITGRCLMEMCLLEHGFST